MNYKSLWMRFKNSVSWTQKRTLLAFIFQSIRILYYHHRTDIYLLSFPKCGRTWLRLMIGRALTNHFGLAVKNLLELYQLADLHPDIPKILVAHDDSPQLKRPSEIFESKTKYKNKKVIFLVRDPRDVIVSLYFHEKGRRNVEIGDIHEYIHRDVGSTNSLIKFYNIWEANKNIPKDFLLVRYEDIQIDPKGELRRVLNFLGLRAITDDTISEAVRYASFDNMREMEKNNLCGSKRLKPGKTGDEETYKTRKGKVNNYHSYLDEDDICYINEKINAHLSNSYGY